MLGSIVHQRIGSLHQIIECGFAASLKLHFKTSGTSQAGNNRWSGKINLTFGILLQVFLHFRHDFVYTGFLTFFPRFQNNGQLTTCLITPDTRTASGYILHISDVWILTKKRDGTLRHLACTLQSSPFGQFELYFEISLIFYRKETGGNNAMQQQNTDQYYAEGTQHASRITNNPGNDTHVFIITDVQPMINFTEHDILLSVIRFQNQRTHDRAERKCNHSRD